ncbi:MAG: TonB-dependent receptor, partial [Acidobacteria bacterium]
MKSSLHFTIVFALLSGFAHAQSPNATIAGRVLDPSSAVLSDAKVEAINLYTNIHYAGQTNREGAFVIPSLPPGPYRIEVSKSGFKTAVREDVVLRVQDIVALNFTLPVGSITESVTVTGGAPLVNTQDATVSTVIDRNFAENLPLNGRSFQTLIALSPGVVLTPANQADPGQFSVNGQRTGSNYFMVDGVSANIGTLPFVTLSQSASGATPGFSVTGGTNNLVSEDALQEFRIQTSTYAPEFGRTPGAQVSIVTRSGTNAFHGALFEFLRNDKLDASDWFANLSQQPKPEERINDFGGVFGGPVIKDRTFFFFSYEGQRLRLPKTSITN